MKWIIFGDLHLNKPFPDLRLNTDKFKSVEDAYAEGIRRFIVDIITDISDVKANVFFVGDITHYNQDKFDRFLMIIDTILDLRRNYHIYALIGNHDTSNSYKLERAKINKLNGYRDRLIVINKITKFISNNTEFLFLPYIKNELILPKIYAYNTNGLVVLSHNNIYSEPYWGDKEVVPFFQIQAISHKIALVNGHIHRFFITDNYYQIGSAAPTSFKEYYYAVGCCIYDDVTQDFQVRKNTKLFFLSINNENYLTEAEILLNQAKRHNTLVFLNSPFKNLYKYKSVVAVEDYENK